MLKFTIKPLNDLPPFGMGMGGRDFASTYYRYQFNGKENLDELSIVNRNELDYGDRFYDSRICRFKNVDRLSTKFPYYSTYQFSGNMPVFANDLDGKEPDPKTIVKAITTILNNEQTPGDASVAFYYLYYTAINQFVDADNLEAGTNNLKEGATKYLRSNLKSDEHNNHVSGQPAKVINSLKKLEGGTQAALGYTQIFEANVTTLTNTALFFLPGEGPVASKVVSSFTKLEGRMLIIDENLSPLLVNKLKNEGYNAVVLMKGLTDDALIQVAKENNAIILTNNIKDFVKKGVTTFEVSQSLKPKASMEKLIEKINKVAEGSKIESGQNVKLVHQ